VHWDDVIPKSNFRRKIEDYPSPLVNSTNAAAGLAIAAGLPAAALDG
jgi:hypothetical protein